jgi:hypothetical protein
MTDTELLLTYPEEYAMLVEHYPIGSVLEIFYDRTTEHTVIGYVPSPAQLFLGPIGVRVKGSSIGNKGVRILGRIDSSVDLYTLSSIPAKLIKKGDNNG